MCLIELVDAFVFAHMDTIYGLCVFHLMRETAMLYMVVCRFMVLAAILVFTVSLMRCLCNMLVGF